MSSCWVFVARRRCVPFSRVIRLPIADHPHTAGFPGAALQVVLLGSGMDSRPWRLLNLPPGVSWFELDMPDVVHAKIARLRDAGAQMHTIDTRQQQSMQQDTQQGDDNALQHALEALRGGSRAAPPSSPSHQIAQPTSYAFPLLVHAWCAVAVDLRKGEEWVVELLHHGFDPEVPTVWVAEGLLYYLQLVGRGR